MIKKINYIVILIASIVSIYIAITKEKELVYILKDLSVIITMSLLYIIQKIFKIKIDDRINLIYILFVFNAHFLGVIIDLYTKVYWFDKFTHFLSGIVSALAALYILKKNIKYKNIIFSVLFIVSFSMLVASTWELFEYTSSILFKVDPQKVKLTGVSDTMGDIIVALLGSMLVSLSYYFENKYNHTLLVKKFENIA